MKTIIGVVLIVIGIALGLYLGLWWAFIGGIIQIIEQIRADEMQAIIIALGIVKILFAGLIGWLAGIIAVLPGFYLLKES